MKTLIAFFSHAGENYFPGGYRNLEVGNAEVIANKVHSLIGGDMFKIETVKEYPFGYEKCCQEAKEEQRKGELPDLKNFLPSVSEYEKIILIYPCWWGTMPQAVFTFLNHYDFSNKIILPICTHEGSGMGRSERDLAKVCPNSKFEKGIAIQGFLAQSCDELLKNLTK